MNNTFFYIFVFVIIIALSYVVYAMYSLPKLVQQESVSMTIIQKPVILLS